MSETTENSLVRQSLELQQTVLPELKEAARDIVKNPTFAGLGQAAIYEWGGAVTVDARLWAEDELRDNGTLFVEVDLILYRIEIRQGSADVRDAYTGHQVIDIKILEKITSDISFMHGVYLFNSGAFEDTADKVVQ